MRFSSPIEFVAALRSRSCDAREELNHRLHRSIRDLVGIVQRRFAVQDDLERLTGHVLRWVELYLVSRPESELKEIGRESGAGDSEAERRFVAYILAAAFRHFLYGPSVLLRERKQSLLPERRAKEQSSDAQFAFALSEVGLSASCLRMPLDGVSGDIADWASANGNLWIIIGDATGHGWLAYAVIDGVVCLWRALLRESPSISPRELCRKLDEHLYACLPDAMFVEATICGFNTKGVVRASPAGVCRLIFLRDAISTVEVAQLGGGYLGMQLGEYSEEVFQLGTGDQLTMASDGLYEQPRGNKQLIADLNGELAARCASESLHEAVSGLLEETLATNAQADDITVVSVSYLETRNIA
jgi:hypothetical protein